MLVRDREFTIKEIFVIRAFQAKDLILIPNFGSFSKVYQRTYVAQKIKQLINELLYLQLHIDLSIQWVAWAKLHAFSF